MSEPPGPGAKARRFPAAVEAALRAVNVQWLERKPGDREAWVRCCHEAYNVLAKHRLESGLSLVDSVLEQEIPNAVFDVAIEKGWIRFQAEPQRRRVVARMVLHRDEP